MTSTRRFANSESPVLFHTFEELKGNAVVLKNYQGEDVFIGVEDVVKFASTQGLIDPFNGAARYTKANQVTLRGDPRVVEGFTRIAHEKALQAGKACEQGNVPTARKLVVEALELVPELPEALMLQSVVEALGTPGTSASASAAAAPPPAVSARPWVYRLFGLGRAKTTQGMALPRRARKLGIDAADFQALRTLAQALSTDRSEGFTGSGIAMAEQVQHMRQHTPERLRAIDNGIRIYGRPFAEALHACLNGRPLNGRHIGPDALANELSAALRALGFRDS